MLTLKPASLFGLQVIKPGLISDEDFDRVQEMITKKQELNVRQRIKIGEFTYNGFLWCAKCGARIHTVRNQFDWFYYLYSNKKRWDDKGDCLCPYTGYMNRDKLEPLLDELLSTKLTDSKVLQELHDQHRQLFESRFPKQNRERLIENYKACYAKRDRFIDMAGDGIITKEQCAERLKVIDAEIRRLHEELTKTNPSPVWAPGQLAKLFAPFTAWTTLDRSSKRFVLNGLAPKFYVADYEIQGLHLDPIEVNIDRPNGQKPDISLWLRSCGLPRLPSAVPAVRG